MPGYKIRDQFAPHFITMTVVGWVDVFSRLQCKEIIIESLKYCIKEKGLVLHAYVIMESHLHLVVSAKEGSIGLSHILRDLKKHTSKMIVKWASCLEFVVQSKLHLHRGCEGFAIPYFIID